MMQVTRLKLRHSRQHVVSRRPAVSSALFSKHAQLTTNTRPVQTAHAQATMHLTAVSPKPAPTTRTASNVHHPLQPTMRQRTPQQPLMLLSKETAVRYVMLHRWVCHSSPSSLPTCPTLLSLAVEVDNNVLNPVSIGYDSSCQVISCQLLLFSNPQVLPTCDNTEPLADGAHKPYNCAGQDPAGTYAYNADINTLDPSTQNCCRVSYEAL